MYNQEVCNITLHLMNFGNIHYNLLIILFIYSIKFAEYFDNICCKAPDNFPFTFIKYIGAFLSNTMPLLFRKMITFKSDYFREIETR
jgi:hypothetical protein